MNNITAFRKFVSGHHLYAGLLITLAVLVPSIVFFQNGLLIKYILVPLGVINVGFADAPGSFKHRLNANIIAIVAYFVVSVIAGFSRDILWLSVIELLIFAVTLSLCGIYGTRMSSIGTCALMCFIFFSDKNFVEGDILLNAWYMTAGGILYFFIFIISYRLRPYKLIQQMLGEHLIELAELLNLRSRYYAPKVDYPQILDQMLKKQVVLKEQQENLREVLFKTRQIVQESTVKSRSLLVIFIDSIDLYERILLSQQDYVQLHKAFDGKHILQVYGRYIGILAFELEQIGLALQQGKQYHSKRELNNAFEKCRGAFYQLRERHMDSTNMEDFIMLRQILYSLQDLTDRIKKLNLFTKNKKDISAEMHGDQSDRENKEKRHIRDFDPFIPKQQYDYRLFVENISFKSGQFRHAIRVAIALLIGLIVSRIFNLGHHSYWVLMTIIIILKPSYSLGRQKNIDRIGGTIVGGVISFLTIYFINDANAIFVIMCFAILLSCSMLRINYFIYAIGITMMVILSYDFISAKVMSEVLLQRILNSGIGCAIGYVSSLFVLPNWEHEQKNQYAAEMLEANKVYFLSVAGYFIGKPLDVDYFKLCRKNAFIALANLSDNFQRMLSDPKRQQVKLEEFHQFVVTSNMLCSYIASLSYYAQGQDQRYISDEFLIVCSQIQQNFETVQRTLDTADSEGAGAVLRQLPVNQKLMDLLEQRKKELQVSIDGPHDTSIRKFLTDYKTINSLFNLINGVISDQKKIVAELTRN
ncbi:FUSC family membrane protein [Arachidicoccus terrestris]|uniref:FUSC family membrane protein n=1 Tax=Arachidicoccus terrestris TaxID=2875539 RepID=UPI001CC5576B|nr:FUSC family membrane protein [Arachidicoccus terrestris]UAY54417.1 FUSC family protein [Arachidicoccus terrestris]